MLRVISATGIVPHNSLLVKIRCPATKLPWLRVLRRESALLSRADFMLAVAGWWFITMLTQPMPPVWLMN
jgi:hypothetical protein